MGSKNRLSKHLAPIIQSHITQETKGYLEPFVGGGNMIDKIQCKVKVGMDIDRYTIATLSKLRDGWIPPCEVSKDFYLEVKNNKEKYEDCLVGYIGYELSFAAKWFGGYVKRCSKKSHGDIYSYKSCMRQAPNLKDTKFLHMKFQDIPKDKIQGYVVYCDPPYKGTTKYKTEEFPYEEFYQWVKDMSVHNTVLVSEYWMPDEFECIWQKEHKTLIDSNKSSGDKGNVRIEKLFTYKC
ncbi:MAG: DNA adenine methylase [Peptostreptococcaceae bacterium]